MDETHCPAVGKLHPADDYPVIMMHYTIPNIILLALPLQKLFALGSKHLLRLTVSAHIATAQITLGRFSDNQLRAILPLLNNVVGECGRQLLPRLAICTSAEFKEKMFFRLSARHFHTFMYPTLSSLPLPVGLCFHLKI
jgi:hypothetical protein